MNSSIITLIQNSTRFFKKPSGVMTFVFLCYVTIVNCAGQRPLKHTETAKVKDTTDTTILINNDSSTQIISIKDSSSLTHNDTTLSQASELIITSCDNYLNINPKSPKSNEVLSIKASTLYNNKRYEQSRSVYKEIVNQYPGSANAYDAIRMIAQSFYEEKRFEDSQEWYRKLSYVAQSGVDKEDALEKIAESIFRLAESFESQKRFKDAAAQYERVSLEFPESKISDIALFNAGLSYEKLTEWPQAILIFQKLIMKYATSSLLPKAQFRIAKAHEKLNNWDFAADAYLKVTITYPASEFAPLALYNTGFCFENVGKLAEAAATFEKMAIVYPQSEDAADILFKAGELYGQIKDWNAVSRVNQTFTTKFGKNQDRIVQALCMVGIALYMQNKEQEAIAQLEQSLITFSKLKNPNYTNVIYAAKATFTIGEIYHSMMAKITLSQPKSLYKKHLDQKSELLDRALSAYTRVIKFNLSEWTTRTIFQIAQIYEDFAVGIFKQERPNQLTLDERISLELGIAEAVEHYFVEKATHYHQQNVKLGIKENIEDKYILQSRQKLTFLPYTAGQNYLSLVEISRKTQEKSSLEGFANIALTLKTLQNIGPFEEKAIDLFLKALELGTTYKETNEFYTKASTTITNISFVVGETYSNIANIARDAPIPASFSAYERFAYKSKLLKQIESYEEQALTHFLKTLKIADAYALNDQSVIDSRERIARLLFNKAYCYDLLSQSIYSNPPFPDKINDAEKEEYKARFDEIALKFQDNAFDTYKTVLNFSSQKYATGDYVTYSYIRLYQKFPNEYGSKTTNRVNTAISSGSEWLYTTDTISGWQNIDVSDSGWTSTMLINNTLHPTGFPGTIPQPMWGGRGNPNKINLFEPFSRIFLRRIFLTSQIPDSAIFYLAAKGDIAIYLNGTLLAIDTTSEIINKAKSFDLTGKILKEKNVIAIRVDKKNFSTYGVYPLLLLTTGTDLSLPKPPGFDKPLPVSALEANIYKFPVIKNFSDIEKGTE